MSQFVHLSDDIFHLVGELGGSDRMFGSYFLWDGAIIEPGPARHCLNIEAGLAQLGYNPTLISHIIPTHIHLDHGGGAGYLAHSFPWTRVILHPQGARHLIDPGRLIASTKLAFGQDFETVYGPILPVPEKQVQIPQDGEKVSVGGRELQLVYAPGHAPHNLALLDLQSGGLFCGEALGTPDRQTFLPLPSAAPPAFDLEEYIKTIGKLKALSPRFLLYSHGRGIGREVEKLTSQAVELAQRFGEIILRALKEGKNKEGIAQGLRDYLHQTTGKDSQEGWDDITLDGYIMYFQKRGQV